MTKLNLLAGAFLLAGAVAAHAQTAPAAPPPASPGGEADTAAPHGRMDYRGMHHEPMMRGAGFRFSKDGMKIGIRCAANEPMKACVDAAAVLIDKVGSLKTAP